MDDTVGRDTPLLDVLEQLARSRALAVTHDGEFDGIVTYADLNKRPFRVLIYAFLAELEGSLGELVRSECPDGDEFIRRYANDLRKRSIGAWVQAVENDVEIHPVERLNLSELVSIVASEEALWDDLDFPSKTQAKKSLGGLVDLRHDVMHPVRFLVREPSDASKLAERLSRLIELLDQRLDAVSVPSGD